MELTWLVPYGHALPCHHRYHARTPLFRPDTHPELFRHRVYKMPFSADTFSKWVRKKRIITFLALAQKRMVECLPWCDSFDRLRMQQTLKQVECLFHICFVVRNICAWGRPIGLAGGGTCAWGGG